MSDYAVPIDALRDRLRDLIDDLDRHVRVLDSIDEDPAEYDDDNIETYLGDVDEALADADFLEAAEDSLETLEETVDAVEQEFLVESAVIVDDEIVDVELLYLEPPNDPNEAALLVESPKVNQVRGSNQLLQLPDGRQYQFSIEETLVADVAEDKTGDLKLVLHLDRI